MPHSYGYRARTKTLFQRNFREHGVTPLKTYLHTYKVGDYVDIKVNSSIHRGMPHKFYHGRTGRVWNVTNRAVGVEVTKQVGNRIIKKVNFFYFFNFFSINPIFHTFHLYTAINSIPHILFPTLENSCSR